MSRYSKHGVHETACLQKFRSCGKAFDRCGSTLSSNIHRRHLQRSNLNSLHPKNLFYNKCYHLKAPKAIDAEAVLLSQVAVRLSTDLCPILPPKIRSSTKPFDSVYRPTAQSKNLLSGRQQCYKTVGLKIHHRMDAA